jgi:hypothetical protein
MYGDSRNLNSFTASLDLQEAIQYSSRVKKALCGNREGLFDRAIDWIAKVLLPERARNFSLIYSLQTDSGPTSPPVEWAPGTLSPGVKRQGREADHSHSSSAELENDRAILPLPPTFTWCGA